MSKVTRLVGKVKDAHSLKGELYFLIFSGDTSWAEQVTEFYLKKNEAASLQKMEVQRMRAHKEGLIVKLKGIEDRTQAEAYRGYLVEVDQDVFVTDEDEEGFYLSEIENFLVRTKADGDLGRIVGFSSNTAQDIILVQGSGVQYEIPLVEEFIVNMDFDQKTIDMELPEGLLDLNAKDKE